ncbi:BadF/BadG/BcrA/BcrD ATPase family protein [Kamptonema sp. UHCC 0994]|uniref:N-acetylglucosamine kinase n=1 Tax=Kamptonema sp. UHCC 0994 TaxID=3031329 RepID=UPI0023BAC7A7|nr:BadF/BadG/BcrA/BcrD ATPase family protein [Kamptonema sp. UHCC 0994]MDF0557005.1 BadF/BadG/BcrA/BcrD ATPase family protein [Kamptonema sp. UHCC 0994]
MSNVLGIDGGGTKTTCILMDKSGKIIGRGEAGPSNYQSVGIETAEQSIKLAIKQAFLSTKADKYLPIEAICLGLAGVGRSQDIKIVESLVKKLQLCDNLPIKLLLKPENTLICNDSQIALVGGIGKPIGIAVIAGTGSHIFGQNHQGKTKRVGGWGYILGDEGSGYDIAIQGLKAALKSFDGRLEFTTLTEQFKIHLHLKNIEDLVEVVYRRGWGVKEIAALAPIVDREAAAGDREALNIIESAATELALATKVAISALFDKTEAYEIVTIGGAWEGTANLRGKFENYISAIAPLATVIWPRHEPASGAGLLALSALNRYNSS